MKNEYMIPPELLPIIGASELQQTKNITDTLIHELEQARADRQNAHKGRAPLVRRRKELETQIMLQEATAFSSHVSADGKTGKLPDGNPFPLNNEQNRKLFGKIHCAEILKELGDVEAQLAEMEVNAVDAQIDFEAACKKVDTIIPFAHVQARALQYMSTGNE